MNNGWFFESAKYKFTIDVPNSVYSVLLDNGIIDDLHFRDNELKFIDYMKEDYVFSKHFKCEKSHKVILCFDGIDTVSEIYINGTYVGKTCNMHRKYEFDITNHLKEENELQVKFPAVYNVFNKLYKDNFWKNSCIFSFVGRCFASFWNLSIYC